MSKVTILTKPNRIVIASKGVQGPPGPQGEQGIQGPKGDTGDVTPEAIAARDAAQEAATTASTAASTATGAASAASGSASAAAASANLAEQARILGATIGFATKADMDASLAHPAGTLALVTSDATAANNGTYRKTGASGSGSWVQSADRVTGLEARTAAVEAGVADLDAATFVIEPATFEQGGLSTTNGNEAPSTTLIRSPFIAGRFISVTCSPTQQVALLRYSATGAYLGWSGWLSSIPATAIERARVMVRNVGSTTLVPADGTAVIKVDRLGGAEARITAVEEEVSAVDSTMWIDSTPTFEQGGFSSANGNEANSTILIRSPFMEAALVTITCASSQQVGVLHYSETGAYLGWTNWQSGLQALPVGRFRIMVRNRDTSALVPADNTAVVKTNRFVSVGDQPTANVPISPEGLSEGKLWSNALSITKARAYPEIYSGATRISPTYQGIYDFMDALVAEFPDYVSRSQIGLSELGKPLYAYRLKPKVYVEDSIGVTNDSLPKIMLVSGVHGDEPVAIKANLIYMAELCRNWREYPMYESIRWGVDLVFVPVLNPDGYDLNTRPNANDVNLNRDFGLISQTESQALAGLINANLDATAYIDHHNYGPSSGTGYVVWVGAEGPSEMGVAAEIIRQVVSNARKEFANAAPDDNSPIGKLQGHIGTTTTHGYAHGLGLDAFLIESPMGLPNYPTEQNNQIHAVGLVARTLNILYEREMRRRVDHFDPGTP